MIHIEHLSKTIRGIDVLRDISLDVPRGCVAGLHGVNGSGKTMLMRVVCGLVRPTTGRVVVDGKELGQDGVLPDSVGALIEGPAFLAGKTAFDNLRLLAEIKQEASDDDIRNALVHVGLDPHSRKKYRAFSLGMKERLGIAAAIMERPRLLVLDEPTNALDASGVVMLKRVVRSEQKRGATVLIACHDAAVLCELSDVVYHVVEGSLEGVGTLVVSGKGGDSDVPE